MAVPSNSDAVAKAQQRVKNAGVNLESDAMEALEKLNPEHAVELLTYIAENCNYLRNPSKYILNSCAKGFVPKSGAGLQPATTNPVSSNPGDPEMMEQLLLKAQHAGVMLSNEALSSLADLPPEHSVELLEFVLDRAQDLRNVSNYIASTVARGFKSRKGVRNGGASQEDVARYVKHLQENGVPLDASAHQALGSLTPPDAVEIMEFVVENVGHLKNVSESLLLVAFNRLMLFSFEIRSSYISGRVSKLMGANGRDSTWTPESVGMNPQHVPPDITFLERRVLSVNASSQGEQIDLISYLALRCLPEWHAKEMLDSLQARKSTISSPCNYIQAAVSKITRGHGRGSSNNRLLSDSDSESGSSNNGSALDRFRKCLNFNFAAYSLIALLSVDLCYHILILTRVVPYKYVWGGRLKSEASMIRFETVSFSLNLSFIVLVVLRAQLCQTSGPQCCLKVLCWICYLIFTLNTVGNILASSWFEMLTFTPVTLYAALAFARLALGEDDEM
eukprot:symbB.v1.2.008859.t1/scaffold553.1/size187910/20